jgi:hypothetical protein
MRRAQVARMSPLLIGRLGTPSKWSVYGEHAGNTGMHWKRDVTVGYDMFL